MDYFDETNTPLLRRKLRIMHSKVSRNRSMRSNPEGNSLMSNKKKKLSLPPADTMDTLRKKKQTYDNFDDFEGKYLAQKSKALNRSLESNSSLDTTTPDTLSQISSIAPYSDVTMHTTLNHFKKAKAKPSDETWENAVSKARGEPDGAEKSFHAKKLSRTVIKEDMEGEEAEHKEDKLVTPTKPLQRKKSIKVHIKNAASKLKILRSKSKLNTSKAGSKRKMDVSAFPDESTVAMKKPKLKELSWKERRHERKMTKNNFEIIKKAKFVWEEMRRHKLPDEKRRKLCEELFKMVSGKMYEFALAHDTARVVQCLVQFGSNEQRTSIMEELKDNIVGMCKSKYAKFVIRKLLKYGTKQQRSFVIKQFHGKVRKLVRHREASEILELAYNEYANAAQRLSIMEEFYGPSFTLFKNHATKSLDQILTEQPDKKDMILSNMKEALLPLVDKEILIHSMIHRIFFEFFTYASGKMRSEMIELLREHLVTILHTRDGARVAMHCVWHGTAKDRKVIIKCLKTHVLKVCKEEYGHMVMLAIIDVVDDTRLVHKALLDEMLKSLDEVAQNQYGRKVLIYLLSPRDPLHFHPDIVHVLQEGDKNTTSKKDGKVRSQELADYVSSALLQYVVDHSRDLVMNNNTLLFILAVISHARGDPTEAMLAISKIAAEPFVAGNCDNFHIVEHPAGHLALKRLILNDKERITANEDVLFSKILLKVVPPGSLKSWAACNRGCFALISLLEVDDDDVTTAVKQQLSGIRKSLKKMTFSGAHLLVKKLEASSPTRPQMIDL
ncbi:pumilio homolog 3-like [Gigantopelta aegis]|uniref:pumilio homolog 3-like n=1 Tax=Gigantopelta aegis TaxID=1735272 RepID=UPI001B88B514|nr:pumilio homolog 3-like [Gigantopelta aegis]XP_041360110.1 pumilio homolog 3-like [Gigantopelta aegis]